jgi:hypothetical protein
MVSKSVLFIDLTHDEGCKRTDEGLDYSRWASVPAPSPVSPFLYAKAIETDRSGGSTLDRLRYEPKRSYQLETRPASNFSGFRFAYIRLR